MVSVVDPSKGQSDISVRDADLVIAVPPVRNWFLIAFLSVWLGGWTVGGAMAATQFARYLGQGAAPDTAFLGFWLCGWLIGELTVFATVGWMFTGKWIVRLNAATLTCGWTIFGLGPLKSYRTADISNFRVAEGLSPFRQRGSFPFSAISDGGIAFDYGRKSVALVYGIDGAEANFIAARMRQFVPALAVRTTATVIAPSP